MASQVCVGSPSSSTNPDRLDEHCSHCGTVASSIVIASRIAGQSRGLGLVERPTPVEAQEAIAKLNDQVLQGRRLTVCVAKTPDRAESVPEGGSWRPRRW